MKSVKITITNNQRITKEEVEDLKTKAELRPPSIRMGQELFNQLWLKYPELADLVRSTSADPFYDNENIERFFQAITKQS